ncbi:MAG: hypothetical protein AAB382_11625 [Chloroflexota bacterium]|jgi:hypothetical protein
MEDKQRNTIIGVVVAVVVLCCCCPAVSYGLYWLWQNGDALLGTTSRVLPALMML